MMDNHVLFKIFKLSLPGSSLMCREVEVISQYLSSIYLLVMSTNTGELQPNFSRYYLTSWAQGWGQTVFAATVSVLSPVLPPLLIQICVLSKGKFVEL